MGSLHTVKPKTPESDPSIDPQRLTALVVLGIKDRDTVPLIFYREDCADMAIAVEDLDASLIANSRALLITGTHFSTQSVYQTSRAALKIAADAGITVKGVQVEVLNVLGAGDAFVSGFLRGWLNGEGYEQALRYANACGALVVSRHGRPPAMPTRAELDYFLADSDAIPRLELMVNRAFASSRRSARWNRGTSMMPN